MLRSASLVVLLILTLIHLPFSRPAADEFLKLPLLHRGPHPSPTQALSLDSRRLVSLLHHRLSRNQSTTKSPLVSGASSGAGQYFVSVHLGTPPQRLLLVADTGSDLIWVRCSACHNCTNHPPGSSFLARHSSSFHPHHCYSAACRLVPQPDSGGSRCNHTRLHSPCRYEYTYTDGSLSSGFFSTETTTLNASSDRTAKQRELEVNFGCGFRVAGPSVTGASFNGAQGVMGLGRGPISFSSQLGRHFGNKFSYCLMDYTLSPPPTSYLVIGGRSNSTIAGTTKMRFTPLLVNPLSPTFYYITIQSAYVDGAKLRINPSVWSLDDLGNGGTIVDSGTTLTFLVDPAYRQIIAAMKRRIALPSAAQTPPGFDLCVNVSGVARPKFPRLSFKLAGGSELSPPPRNYFIDTAEGVKCLAIQAVNSESTTSVIGNLMQQGFLLEFDRDRSRLGFSRRGCALP